jgi:pSer/pThr/pTyr-binding forkhead associated (FHA) protein
VTKKIEKEEFDLRVQDAIPEEEATVEMAPAEKLYLVSPLFDDMYLEKGKPVRIGRLPKNELVLPSKLVSRYHATIDWVQGHFILKDLGSSNGTILNDRKIKEAQLKAGDEIGIGPFHFNVKAVSPGHISTKLESDFFVKTQAFAVPTLEPSGLSGNLQELSLSELLQTLEFNEKTGTLTIRGKDREGQILIHQGEPVTAFLGDVQDEEAIFEMLRILDGTFFFSNDFKPARRTITLRFTQILLDAHRVLDENEASRKEDMV